jgi:hypothetical protein
MGKYYNVEEQWFLYDTIMVSPYVSSMPHQVPGWFASFAAFGASDDITFFNSRNKQIGLAYNNQDARDQLSYAYTVESLSVAFLAPACSSQLGELTTGAVRGRTDILSSIWQNELPFHTSAIWRVNQDEILKGNAAILPPGYGPVGFSMGQADTSDLEGFATSVTAGGMSRAHLKYRWEFPEGIGVPRRATTAVTLRLTEWARQAFQAHWGPGLIQMWTQPADEEVPILAYRPSAFMIQVLLSGVREVQQRGAYHA